MGTNARRFNKILCFLTTLLLPQTVDAISLSEVAWMGTTASANHEWIELHNPGAATDVTGWRLTDDRNFDITLEGTVPAGSYVVLERTSDASAPGSAFLVYTGALVNSGGTLRLLDASGSVVDQLSGGEGWENIGGDNTTKETAQYTTAGWITAAATPGASPPSSTTAAEDSAEATEDETDTETDASGSSANLRSRADDSGSSETVRLELPDVTLELAIDAQRIGYVNQAIAFTVEPSGIGPHLTDSLTYEWNFGDFHTANGKTATHHFAYPGEYVVTVRGAYKRQEQVARHRITILPTALSLTRNRAGDVQLHNDSQYEVDVSGYRLVGLRTVTVPPRTILLPQQTITLPAARLGDSAPMLVMVYDPQGSAVAAHRPADLPARRLARAEVGAPGPVAPRVPPPAATPPPPAPASPPPTPAEVQSAPPATADSATETPPAAPPDPNVAAVAAAAPGDSSAPLPRNERIAYALLFVVLVLGIFGVYLAPRGESSPEP